jgi:hypothetical protein
MIRVMVAGNSQDSIENEKAPPLSIPVGGASKVDGSQEIATRSPSWGVLILAALVICRLLIHAVYIPAYEGPDEPFHLGRAAAFVDSDLRAALEGNRLDERIVASIRANPCGSDLQRIFECPPFDGHGAAFNILSPVEGLDAEPIANYEAHQPPLYYAVSGFFISITERFIGAMSPVGRLMFLRLFSVVLVVVGMLVLLRVSRGRPPTFSFAFLGCLLLPGAAESLARCANDAAVFLWVLVALAAIESGARQRWILPLLAIGPLIKLTVAPIVVLVLAWLVSSRGWQAGLAGAATAGIFVPVQWLRGWAWGGTVELNAPSGTIDEGLLQIAIGFGRSVYTFVKTALWLGEWSFFRPPMWLVVLAFMFIAAWALSIRIKTEGRWQIPPNPGLFDRCFRIRRLCGQASYSLRNLGRGWRLVCLGMVPLGLRRCRGALRSENQEPWTIAGSCRRVAARGLQRRLVD